VQVVRAIVAILAIAIFPTLYLVFMAGRPDSISYFAGVVAGLGLMAAVQCYERFRHNEPTDLERHEA
jgi:hypothetical protein